MLNFDQRRPATFTARGPAIQSQICGGAARAVAGAPSSAIRVRHIIEQQRELDLAPEAALARQGERVLSAGAGDHQDCVLGADAIEVIEPLAGVLPPPTLIALLRDLAIAAVRVGRDGRRGLGGSPASRAPC
jgi:hypothetical protein